MATITGAPNPFLPGAVSLVVVTDVANTPGSIVRIDGPYQPQPVRNYTGTGATVSEAVVDCEAPLGRSVYYQLLDFNGSIVAQSNTVELDAPHDGRSLLRSVLRPSVNWLWVEPVTETGVEWSSSTTVHEIPGSDTPVVVSEVRQRHKGRYEFLAKSIHEADQIVSLCRDGTLLLLRHSPCAGEKTRDTLVYPRDITEVLHGNGPWRRIVVEYQSTRFVPGNTDEPPLGSWTFADLAVSAPDFATLPSMWPNFATMALLPYPPWTPLDSEVRVRRIEEERERRARA
jgi:hypothetical protein